MIESWFQTLTSLTWIFIDFFLFRPVNRRLRFFFTQKARIPAGFPQRRGSHLCDLFFKKGSHWPALDWDQQLVRSWFHRSFFLMRNDFTPAQNDWWSLGLSRKKSPKVYTRKYPQEAVSFMYDPSASTKFLWVFVFPNPFFIEIF